MPTSPERRGGKRQGRRRMSQANRRVQKPAWKSFAVNASVAVPAYGSVTVHLPQLSPGAVSVVSVVAGAALATWLNARGGRGRD